MSTSAYTIHYTKKVLEEWLQHIIHVVTIAVHCMCPTTETNRLALWAIRNFWLISQIGIQHGSRMVYTCTKCRSYISTSNNHVFIPACANTIVLVMVLCT